MKLRTSIVLGIGLVAAVSSKSQAANLFTYGSNERELYRTSFGTDFNVNDGWNLDKTSTFDNNVLRATQDNWSSALYDLSSLNLDQLDLDNGDIGVYWSFNTDKTTNERSKVYMQLNVTDDPNRIEQRHIGFNIVPTTNTQRPYELYVDPEFCPTTNCNLLVQEIKPPSTLFPNKETFESFRLSISKIDENTVKATPYYRYGNSWELFSYQNNTSPVSLTMDIDDFLEGQDSFKSFSFLFRSNVPSVDAFAVTQTPSSPSIPKAPVSEEVTTPAPLENDSEEVVTPSPSDPASVPEPSSIISLLAIGVLGASRTLKSKLQ